MGRDTETATEIVKQDTEGTTTAVDNPTIESAQDPVTGLRGSGPEPGATRDDGRSQRNLTISNTGGALALEVTRDDEVSSSLRSGDRTRRDRSRSYDGPRH